MPSIDINCDMGEIPETILDGTQESLMPSLTSVNIACGGHAGDGSAMKVTIAQASPWNLNIGAHPGYPDRANFGRLTMHLSLSEIEATVFEQVRDLSRIAASLGVTIVHVKPHGALYNEAAGDVPKARAIARGVARLSRKLILVGLAGSLMLDVFREEGFTAVGEAFADRLYEPNGTLRSRKFDDALIRDPDRAAQQALRIAQRGEAIASNGAAIALSAQTICIHGDSPGARQVAAAVAEKLRESGVALRPLTYRPPFPIH